MKPQDIVYFIFSPVKQEFAFSLPLDFGLLRASLLAGEPVDRAEVLSLAASAEAFFITVTIESRELGRVDECLRLWRETAEVFEGLSASWADASDPSVAWLASRLRHYRDLCQDRVEIYSITGVEREAFARNRSDFESEDANGPE